MIMIDFVVQKSVFIIFEENGLGGNGRLLEVNSQIFYFRFLFCLYFFFKFGVEKFFVGSVMFYVFLCFSFVQNV